MVRIYRPHRRGLTKYERKQVKDIVKNVQELKYHNISDTQNVPDTGLLRDLTAISQGDTDQTRDGDKLMPTSIHCKFQLGRADVTNILRVIIFRWLPEDTTAVDPPALTKILQTTLASQPMAQLNHDFRAKFQVLYDRMATVDQAGKELAYWKWDKKLAKVPVKYSAGTTNGMGKIYMLMVSDSSAVAHPTFLYDIRINYTDS